MTSEKLLEKIEGYLLTRFDRLASSTEGIEIYKGLIEIRTILRDEVTANQIAQQKANSVYAQLARLRERPVLNKELQMAKQHVTECMKLIHLLPHKR